MKAAATIRRAQMATTNGCGTEQGTACNHHETTQMKDQCCCHKFFDAAAAIITET